jgi:putative ABC transport system ATP-binding protein
MSSGLEISNITVSVGSRRLFADVSLSVAPGHCVALNGPSGLGKTSLLRVLAALDDADTGTLLLEGRSPESWGYPAWRRRVMMVPQRPLMVQTTVQANLKTPFSLSAIDLSFDADAAASMLQRVGLSADVLAQAAEELSVGEMQRVSLVRALLLEPDYLLLDEPTSALDQDSVDAVEALLRDEQAQGRGILLVTHNRQQAERLGDSTIDLTTLLPSAGGA